MQNPSQLRLPTSTFIPITFPGPRVMGFLALTLFCPVLWGKDLLRYNFTGSSPAATVLASDVAGSNAAWAGGSGGFSSLNNDAFLSTANTPPSYDRGIYLSVTITAAPGCILNPDSFTFQLGGTKVGGGGNISVSSTLRTDADLYATTLELTPGPVMEATHSFNLPTPTYTTYTADLRHPIYQGRTTLTFRLYGADSITSTIHYLRYDSLVLNGTVATAEPRIHEHDFCVYGGTSGGVVGAVQAARMGKKAALLAYGRHIGGMSSGGLGLTDTGVIWTIGGISKEFYQRVGAKYGGSVDYTFEPHVAEAVFNDLVSEAGVDVYYGQRLASVTMDGNRIKEITMDNGEVHRAAMFLDASYEGDLMAMAGVTYTVGREANSTYGETVNGVRVGGGPSGTNIDPYVIPGDPTSGFIPNVQTYIPAPNGSADALTQAYNFRVCLSQAANRIPIAPPADYDPYQYELLARFIGERTLPLELLDFMTLAAVGNGKTDTNNRAASISTDLPGASWDYPEADHLARAEIWHKHEDFMRGFFYFLSTDSRVPANVRSEMLSWGLAADEFQDNGGWPHQLYVREARRMISDYVMTELNSTGVHIPDDPVALASYPNDSHAIGRIVVNDVVRLDGGLFVDVDPYGVSYRSIIPRAGECSNLFVTFALSSSHVCFGSMRMEPVFMMTSQSAATAACMAIDDDVDVQQVDYPKLAAQLIADNQVIPVAEEGLVVENSDAAKVDVTGTWSVGSSPGYSGFNYNHDQNAAKGTKSFRFIPDIATTGSYEVEMWWVSNTNRASNVPVDIHHANGTTTVSVNQKIQGSQWVPLGTYDFNSGTSGDVLIRTTGTDGYVIADAVRLQPAESSGAKVMLWTHDGIAAEPATGAIPEKGAFIVSRSSVDTSSSLDVMVEFSGRATNGVDYVALSQTVTIPANETSVVVSIEPLSDNLPEGTETIGVQLLGNGASYFLGDLQTATITIADQPYQNWLKQNFNSIQLADPSTSGNGSDPDMDGRSNLEEAFFGTSPLVGDTPAEGVETSFVSKNGKDHLAIEFSRYKSPGATFDGEVAGSLMSGWQSGSGEVEQSLLWDDGVRQRFRVRDRTPVDEAPRRFLRLKIFEP